MAIYTTGDFQNITLHRPVITIGSFDGVHLGHLQILEEVKRHADKIGGESIVITFEPHPRKVLEPEYAIQILTPLPAKLDLIKKAGIQHVAVIPFTKEFASLSAEDYIEDFLVNNFHPTTIVIGYDHRFGHDRQGDITLLKKCGAQYGFDVHEIPAQMVRDAAISSTRIRETLHSGNVSNATQLLGRPYAISGTIVKGQQLGRVLGYPTANLQLMDKSQLVPAIGVYAAQVSIGNEIFDSMMSIGTRPTVVNDGQLSIEAHIFDFDRDIYGQEISIHFIKRMRDELKFESLETLKAALAEDEEYAREILNKHL